MESYWAFEAFSSSVFIDLASYSMALSDSASVEAASSCSSGFLVGSSTLIVSRGPVGFNSIVEIISAACILVSLALASSFFFSWVLEAILSSYFLILPAT